MARYAYFADMPDGRVLEWRDGRDKRGNVTAAEGVAYVGRGQFVGYVGRDAVPITRRVELKPAPSRHECDARCLNATGRTMRCECACGGRNHGRGAIACTAA